MVITNDVERDEQVEVWQARFSQVIPAHVEWIVRPHLTLHIQT